LQLLEQAKGLFSPPADDLAHLDRLLSIGDKLASLRGGGGEGQRSGWDIGLDYVRELTPIAQYLGSIFGLRTAGMSAAPAPGGVPGTAATAPRPAFNPYERPDLLRQYVQSLNGSTAGQTAAATAPGPGPSTATPPPMAPPPNGSSGAPPNDLLTTFQMYGGLVVQALNSGMPGYDFADHITELTGNATHAMISAYGADALVHTMLSIPEIALFGEPRLRTFTGEFINYEAYLQQVSEEDELPVESEKENTQRKRAHVAASPAQ
jgi:hypothetical protein